MQYHNLTEEKRKYLPKLFQKFKALFDGIFGTQKIDPVYSELKYAKLVFLKQQPVPKVHELMFKKEVKLLVLLGVLEIRINLN